MSWFHGAHQHLAPVGNAVVNPDLIGALLEASNSLWLAKLFNVGALTIVSWDIVLTFNDEVEYVWKSRWNPIRALYMTIRYFILVAISLDSIILFHPTISPSRYACDIVIRTSTTLSLVGMAATMLLLLIRVWVMWCKNLWVLIALLASFFTLQVASISMIIPGVYVVITVVVLTIIGTTNIKTLRAAIGSGMFLGVTSSMCCRLVLRLRSYVYTVPTLSMIGDDFPMTILPSQSRSELL
ncbi:hypothetical protein BDV93DRAFT_556546 [Ceratobasidium sp. AG-I]|nr:hypothetical protein BDV93DRAFT_556546 [Ceratobasidium sp. AG-I]